MSKPSRKTLCSILLRLIAVAIIGLIWCISGCQKKSPKENKPQSQSDSVVKAKPPSPPDPGRVSLSLSGTESRKINGVGVQCSDWSGNNFSVYILSNDVEGIDSPKKWMLSAGKFGADDTSPLTVNFLADQKDYRWQHHYVWKQTEKKTSGFQKSDSGVQLDIVLQEEETGEQVHLKGTVICPTLITRNNVPPSVEALLKQVTGQPVRKFSSVDFGRAKEHSAISSIVHESAALDAVRKLRSKLPKGWVAFVGTTNWLGDEKHKGQEIVVGPGVTQFDILRIARSDAVNYDMGTEALVKKLEKYDSLVGIDIFHAETDTVEFSIKRLPEDVGKFAKDIYEFCPDSVDQGVGSLEALENLIRETKQLYLWWD